MVFDDLMADPSILLPRHGAPQATDIKSKTSFIRSLRTP